MQKRIYRVENEPEAVSGEKEDKYTFKDIMVIVFAWGIALSLVYLCYLKFKLLYH